MFLKVSNNNRADTVLCAFIEAVNEFGLPQRVRSDKGGENVKVAEFMLQHQTGVPRCFIAGRSVHNQRLLFLILTQFTICYCLFNFFAGSACLNVKGYGFVSQGSWVRS